MCVSKWSGGEPAGCGLSNAPASGAGSSQGSRAVLVCCRVVLVRGRGGTVTHRQTWEAVQSYGVWAPALLTDADFPWCVRVYIYRHGTYLNGVILK